MVGCIPNCRFTIKPVAGETPTTRRGNCRFPFVAVFGEDTDHGGLPVCMMQYELLYCARDKLVIFILHDNQIIYAAELI